jgi:hypothetical protein
MPGLKKISLPDDPIKTLNKGEVWILENNDIFPIRIERPTQLMQRHKKKYAMGDMQDNSFYLPWPWKKIKLEGLIIL